MRLEVKQCVDRSQNQTMIRLKQLHEQLKSTCEQMDYTEIDIMVMTEKLEKLRKILQKQAVSNSIDGKRTGPLIFQPQLREKQIKNLHVPIINKRARWESNGVTVAGGNGRGHQLNQLNGPRGLFVDGDHTIYIADYRNHRTMEWKRNVICDYGNQRVMKYTCENCTTGVKVSTVNSHGLAMDINNILYTSDYEKEAVLRDTNEKSNRVAGGNGTANLLNQFSYPTYIFVDLYNSIYISDTHNHRVMKWTTGANQGIVVAGGHGQGNDLKQLSSPRQISVDFFGNIYIADSGNHRIMRWFKNDLQGTVIAGGNNPGNQPNQLKFPWGLSFDQLDNLYVADWGNSRIQRFDIESN